VSIFDGSSHGDALREICDFAGGFTGENLRENGRSKTYIQCRLETTASNDSFISGILNPVFARL